MSHAFPPNLDPLSRYHPQRTSSDYLQRIDPDVFASFSPEQLAAVTNALEAAIPKSSPKLVDLRFGVDLLFSRFYVVLLVGKDRRKQSRPYLPKPVSRIGNKIAAVLLLLTINLLISLFIALFVYLVKSAVGIDLFPHSHLTEQVHQF
ncbi:MAG TPA: hypothetical protein V6D10_16220 [Trichocoleus sp.]|jgi:hypothetical protein